MMLTRQHDIGGNHCGCLPFHTTPGAVIQDAEDSLHYQIRVVGNDIMVRSSTVLSIILDINWSCESDFLMKHFMVWHVSCTHD